MACGSQRVNRHALHTYNYLYRPFIFKKYTTCYDICQRIFDKHPTISLELDET